MQNREPFQVDYRLRRYDGQYRSVIDTGAPRFGPQGEFFGYIGGGNRYHRAKAGGGRAE